MAPTRSTASRCSWRDQWDAASLRACVRPCAACAPPMARRIPLGPSDEKPDDYPPGQRARGDVLRLHAVPRLRAGRAAGSVARTVGRNPRLDDVAPQHAGVRRRRPQDSCSTIWRRLSSAHGAARLAESVSDGVGRGRPARIPSGAPRTLQHQRDRQLELSSPAFRLEALASHRRPPEVVLESDDGLQGGSGRRHRQRGP